MEKGVMTVEDVTRTTLHTINGLATVQEAIEVMKRENVSSLIIEKRHESDEYGIVNVRDIAGKVVAVNRPTGRTSVYEIMSKPALTLSSTMNIKYAIRLLSDLDLTRALALKGGDLLGIVSMRDLVLAYTDQGDEQS